MENAIGTRAVMKKWNRLLESADVPAIRDFNRRAVVAQLLENQEKSILKERSSGGGFQSRASLLTETPANAMGASSSTAGDGSVDIYDPILISLVRRAMPNLIAYDVVGVQPMTGPTGLIFAMRSRYATQAGTEALFNEADTGFTAAWAGNTANPSGWIGHTGTSAAYANSTGYTTQGGMSTANAEALGANTTHEFEEMAFSIEKLSVTAKERALKAEYTVELAQDLQAVHGLDAEGELANILVAEILTEINREIIRSINWTATVGAQTNVQTAGTFDLDVDSNGRWSVEKWKGLMMQIERDANQIAKATRRGKGNFVICGSDVASALNMAGVLDYNPQMASALEVDDTGNTFAGILLGRYRVYVDPYFSDSSGYEYATVGYKGSSPFDAGMFYCPYVPLQMFRAVGENSFQPKIAFKTRYGLVAHPFATSSADGAVSYWKKNYYYRRINIKHLM